MASEHEKPMTIISKEAVEAAARAMCDDGCNWDNKLPGHRKTMWLDRAEIALKTALPFLALRPAPRQSDEEAADAVLFGKERGIHTNDKERDLYAISVASLVRAFAAVREEATLDGAAAEGDECAKLIEENSILFCSDGPNQLRPRMDGDRAGLDYAAAIRARKPPAPTCAENAQVAALAASPAPDPAEAMRAKCGKIATDYQTRMEMQRDEYAAKGTRLTADLFQEHANAAEEIAARIAALKGNGEVL